MPLWSFLAWYMATSAVAGAASGLAVVGADRNPDAARHLELELLEGSGRPRVAGPS
jgi:hypothetical protein